MLKSFDDFINENSGSMNEAAKINIKNVYITLKTVGKNLEISLSPKADIDEMQDMVDQNGGEGSFYDFFDTIQGNSEMLYFGNLGDAGFGLRDAPGITDGYYMNDDGEYESHEDAQVWFYNIKKLFLKQFKKKR
jgi:hypothetical protein